MICSFGYSFWNSEVNENVLSSLWEPITQANYTAPTQSLAIHSFALF